MRAQPEADLAAFGALTKIQKASKCSLVGKKKKTTTIERGENVFHRPTPLTAENKMK